MAIAYRNSKTLRCNRRGGSINNFVALDFTKYLQRHKADAMNRKLQSDPEKRKRLTAESAERLKKWRVENPEKVKASANKAQACRTADTFARQSETIKETLQRKSVKFAELVMEAKENGVEITPQLHADLLKEAARLVKKERAAEKKRKNQTV